MGKGIRDPYYLRSLDLFAAKIARGANSLVTSLIA